VPRLPDHIVTLSRMTNNTSKDTAAVSVIVPAYNAERWIGRAIASVLRQTVRPAEIIVVDDGSTDGTADVVRKHGTTIRYFRQQNSGPSLARNRGLQEATGEWIALLDADDEWLPHKTESQLDVLRDNSNLKWCGSACEIVNDVMRLECWPSTGVIQEHAHHAVLRYFPALLQQVWFITSGFVLHRSVFDDLGGFDPELRSGEDIDMWCRIALRYPEIGYCFEPCWLYYRDNPDSACRRGRTHRDLPLRSFCRNMRRAMELGPEAADDFRPYARKKIIDNLLRLAARDCLIQTDTIEEVHRLFPLGIHERVLLGILSLLPKILALKVVNRLRGRISL
jgi:glycosyltransferase involved in cell wall biosynthesis